MFYKVNHRSTNGYLRGEQSWEVQSFAIIYAGNLVILLAKVGGGVIQVREYPDKLSKEWKQILKITVEGE